MPLRNVKDLFIHELRDLYDAETQLLRALPHLIEAATGDDFRLVLEEHLQFTRKHLVRLDRIFENLGAPATGHTCNGMKGLIKEVEKLLQEEADDTIRDVGLIAAAQRIAHYEIAAYSSARSFADGLGCDDFAWMLTETLEDEREANQRLTSLSSSALSVQAA
jgi:ferritin-like metal-binding protein YciE